MWYPVRRWNPSLYTGGNRPGHKLRWITGRLSINEPLNAGHTPPQIIGPRRTLLMINWLPVPQSRRPKLIRFLFNLSFIDVGKNQQNKRLEKEGKTTNKQTRQ